MWLNVIVSFYNDASGSSRIRADCNASENYLEEGQIA